MVVNESIWQYSCETFVVQLDTLPPHFIILQLVNITRLVSYSLNRPHAHCMLVLKKEYVLVKVLHAHDRIYMSNISTPKKYFSKFLCYAPLIVNTYVEF